jgi:hypothetical protein
MLYRGFDLTLGKPSIPTVVVSIIRHDPAVYQCMTQKLINYHALAASIKSDVERMAERQVSINTIVVAVMRFSETISKAEKPKPLLILRDARITLASDVVDVTIKAKGSELSGISKRLTELSTGLNEPIHIFQLSKSIRLIADESEYKSLIRPSLDRIQIIRETADLSRLNIHLAPAAEITPEFGLFLTELLYRHGIRIRQTYIGEETVLTVDRHDGPRAYEILREEIDGVRESVTVDVSPSRVQTRA